MAVNRGAFTYRLTGDQIRTFDEDGVIPLRQVASPQWVERLRAAVDRPQTAGAGPQENGYFMRMRVWERDPDLKAFVFESPIGEIAAQLMQATSVNMLYDQIFVKEPGTATRTPWHHDLTYWPVRGTDVITLWVALDPVSLENGGMEFVRGSHRLTTRYRPFNSTADGEVLDYFHGDDDEGQVDLPDFDAEREKHDFVSWDLEPGDAVVFHALSVHGASQNRHRSLRRRAYAVRMTGPTVRYYDGKVWNKFIMNPDLKTGDALTSPQYPILYQA